MNLTEYFEFGLVAIVLVAIIVGVVVLIKKRMCTIKTSDDLVEYIMSSLQDNIVPYILKNALKEELDGCMNYAEFSDRFANKFIDELFEIATSDKLNDVLQVPDNLKQFVTKENIRLVVDKAFKLKEVDDFIYDIYMKLIDQRLEEIKKIDDEVVAYNAKVGVEDDETLEKERMGIAKMDDDIAYVDIGSELVDHINSNQMFVEEEIEDE